MNSKLIESVVNKANCSLDLKRKIVGIKLIDSKDEYDRRAEGQLKNKLTYCVLIKMAMLGRAFKVNLDNFSCLSAARALGIVEPDEEWLSGCVYRDRGMYQDLEKSKIVVDHTTNVQRKTYGVVVKPLEQFSNPPDIVIIITNAYNAMRLIQGYTYTYGTYKNFKVIGNQALCSELTAYPLESDEINLSMLCAGTRYMAGWSKDELGIGIPFNKFTGMIEGLYNTINIMEPNEDKQVIEEKLKEANLNDFEIEYDKNYYTGLYLKNNSK